MSEAIRDVSKNTGIFDLSRKEITIPLPEYTDLIAKETVLEQVRHAVTKADESYGTIDVLKAILQIDDQPKKEK